MEEMIVLNDKNNIVKKHNTLIRKARYSLSEQGIKIISILICMIKKDDEDFKEYNLLVRDFAKLTNTSSKDIYRQVDELTSELMSKPFKIGDEKFNWCYYASYTEGQGYLKLKIAPELKPYLLGLKENFTKYNLENILSLKSKYVIKLYEYCVAEWQQYKYYNKLANEHTFEIKIDDFKNLFEVPQSQQYADIKRHILDKAIVQFAQKTDIILTYKEEKIAKKVVAISITIKDNKPTPAPTNNAPELPTTTIQAQAQAQNKIYNDFNTFKTKLIEQHNNREPFINNITDLGWLKTTSFSIKNNLLYNNYAEKYLEREEALEIWNYMFHNQDKIKIYN